MRVWTSLALCALLSAPSQADTLRVGSRVLATGDTAARVIELLGQPVHRAAAKQEGARTKGSRRGKADRRRQAGKAETDAGERWQYRRGARTVTIVLVQGRVARIE